MGITVLNVAYPLAPVGPDAVGGAEQILTALDDAVCSAGQRSLVVACAGSVARGELIATPWPKGHFDEATRDGVHATVRARIHEVLAREPVDVVHLHAVDFHKHMPHTDVPTLVTLHLPAEYYPIELLRDMPRHVSLQCVSQAQRRTFPADLAMYPEIPNGVSLTRFAPRSDVDDYVLVLGRVCPEKGVHLALEAARRLDLRAIVAGQVFAYATHERYFQDEVWPRLDNGRVFIGPVGMEAKRTLLARARCLVVPSLVPETSSLVAMEALASGTPVVAFRRGALPDVVEHGKTGLLVDDYAGLVDALRRVDGLDRAACRRAAEERFSDRPMRAAYLDTYRTLAKLRPRVTRARRTEPPLDVSVLRSVDELAALEGAWAALWERCPDATSFQRPEWLLPWCRHLMQGEVHTLAAFRDGRLVGLVPWFRWQDGDRRVLSMLAAGVTDYQETLFDPEEREHVPQLLADWLEGHPHEWDACAFSELLPGGALARFEVEGLHERRDQQETCPALALARGASLADLVHPHLFRNLGTARRRAARLGAVSLERADAASFDAAFEALGRLHRARRAQQGDEGALGDRAKEGFYRDAARALHGAGLLDFAALRIGDAVAAVVVSFWEREATRFLVSGFDPAYASASPLSLLIADVVERSLARGALLCDFMRGAEPYKYRWGARDRLTLGRRHLTRAGDA